MTVSKTTTTQDNNQATKLYTLYEVADILRIHYETARRYVRRGVLEAIKLPGNNSDYRVSQKSLNKFLKEGLK